MVVVQSNRALQGVSVAAHAAVHASGRAGRLQLRDVSHLHHHPCSRSHLYLPEWTSGVQEQFLMLS